MPEAVHFLDLPRPAGLPEALVSPHFPRNNWPFYELRISKPDSADYFSAIDRDNAFSCRV